MHRRPVGVRQDDRQPELDDEKLALIGALAADYEILESEPDLDTLD